MHTLAHTHLCQQLQTRASNLPAAVILHLLGLLTPLLLRLLLQLLLLLLLSGHRRGGLLQQAEDDGQQDRQQGLQPMAQVLQQVLDCKQQQRRWEVNGLAKRR